MRCCGRHAAVAAVTATVAAVHTMRGVPSFQQHNLLVPVQILTRKLGEIEKKYGLADKSKVRRFGCQRIKIVWSCSALHCMINGSPAVGRACIALTPLTELLLLPLLVCPAGAGRGHL